MFQRMEEEKRIVDVLEGVTIQRNDPPLTIHLTENREDPDDLTLPPQLVRDAGGTLKFRTLFRGLRPPYDQILIENELVGSPEIRNRIGDELPPFFVSVAFDSEDWAVFLDQAGPFRVQFTVFIGVTNEPKTDVDRDDLFAVADHIIPLLASKCPQYALSVTGEGLIGDSHIGVAITMTWEATA